MLALAYRDNQKILSVADDLLFISRVDPLFSAAVEILPLMPAFEGKPWEEVVAYMEALVARINATLPSTHRIMKTTVRTEDFKRTGSMKVARV